MAAASLAGHLWFAARRGAPTVIACGFLATWALLAALALGCSGGDDSSTPDGGSEAGKSADATIDSRRPPSDAAGDRADVAPRDGAGSDGPLADGPAGSPSLVALSVTSGDDASAIVLTPAFSPTTFDYYVRCAVGANPLVVMMSASPGATSQISLPTLSAAAPTQTVRMSVNEGEAVVANAISGGVATQYWVRCLPHNFPPIQAVLHPEAGAPTAGYYLVAMRYLGVGTLGYSIILDMHGVPVWYSAGTAQQLGDTDSLDSGVLSVKPVEAQFQLHTIEPSATSKVDILNADEHELQPLSDGNYLLFRGANKTGVDLTGLSVPLDDGGVATYGKDSTIFDCSIIEVNAKSGAVLWTWDFFDHFDPLLDLALRNQSIILPGNVVDVFHCNSIAIDKNANLLVSARNMSSIFYIDRQTRRVLWKMGGPTYNKDGAEYVSVSDTFHGQHDARLQPSWSYTCSGGSGEISMFDDETTGPGPARAVIYQVTVPPPGDGGVGGDCGAPADAGVHAKGVATNVWQYQGAGTPFGGGSFRILADGSRTIGWGFLNVPPTLSEVDEEGHELFTFSFLDLSWSYRAIKVPLSQFDLASLRATAGTWSP